MEDDSQEGKRPTYSRYRSPIFSKNETKALITLVEKYKNVVLNKSTTAAATEAKDNAWSKIAQQFNSKGFKHERTADGLKTKWDNLKKEARKVTKNLIDDKYGEFDEIFGQIVSMLNESESNSSCIDNPHDLEDELDQPVSRKKTGSSSSAFFDECRERQSDDSTGDGDDKDGRKTRSLNFSSRECRLLLQCVKEERKHIFCKDYTNEAIDNKNQAWSRITEAFNKQNLQKRTTKVLRTKFSNMKYMARSASSGNFFKDFDAKSEKTDNEATNIKLEPDQEYKMEIEMHSDNNVNDFDDKQESDCKQFTSDPLSTVLNSDSGIGSMNPLESWNPWQNKEVLKLKMEILNYQMETAKLERRRVEESARAAETEHEARAAETALRLRAARLHAAAAEAQLPPGHPALGHTPQETRAFDYLHRQSI